MSLINWIGMILILLGSFFMFVAALGIIRLKDLLLQMHAATKAGTLGAGLVLFGVGIQLKNVHGMTEILLLIFFIALTNPIAAHIIAKTAYRTRHLNLIDNTKLDPDSQALLAGQKDSDHK